jgi:hypothetical protein
MLAKQFLLLATTAMPMASALRSSKTATGVTGWCDFTWANANKVQNVQCGAKDTACDSHSVYALVSLSNQTQFVYGKTIFDSSNAA